MFCCAFLCVHSSNAIILMGKRELVALLDLSSWFLVMVERLFLAVPWGCLRFVIVVFPDHTHLLFWKIQKIITNLSLPIAHREDILDSILSNKEQANPTMTYNCHRSEALPHRPKYKLLYHPYQL